MLGTTRARHATAALAGALALGLVCAPAAGAQSGGSQNGGSQNGGSQNGPAGSQQGSVGAQDPAVGSVPLQPSPAQGSLHGLATGSVAGLTYLGGSVPLGVVLGGLDAVGSSDFARPGGPTAHGEPRGTRDTAITPTRVVGDRPRYDNENGENARARVWTVESAAMQRRIEVEVYLAPDGVKGPAVYFLDGLGSENPSGWSRGSMGFGNPDIRSRPMTVVAPMGGPSSMWSDWNSDDPHLGANEWETFLATELPPLLKEKLGDTFNGHMGALGVSMGAAGAVNLVNRANRGDYGPDAQRFDAAGGVSGCYSTTDDLGYQYVRLTVEASGGTPAKLWGERGSQQWRAHDSVVDHRGLDSSRVYLSAATGLIGKTDLVNFGSDEQLLLDGHILEKGAFESTHRLENALRGSGATVATDYEPTGIHNWPVFVPRTASALDHMFGPDKNGMGPIGTSSGPRAGLRAAGAGTAQGSAGSTGSTGSLGG